VPRAQDLSQRTYFARHRVPPNGGVIDWNSSAVEISRMVRALDFGPYDNTLGSAKVRIGDRFYVCNAAAVVRGGSGLPGVVLHAGQDAIVVACGADAIRIEAVSSIDGGPLELASVVHESALSAGTQLRGVAPDELKRIEQAFARASPHGVSGCADLRRYAGGHPFLHLHAGGTPRDSRLVRPGIPLPRASLRLA
jgi:hypothetical protein